jgi:pyrophosphatase PpaX
VSRKRDTVLFDFDGTVMNTNDLIIDSWQHAFRTITGAEGSLDAIRRSFGEPLSDTVARFFPGIDVEEAVRIYRSWHVDRFVDAIKLFDGIPELLETLRQQGYTMGLVTARLYRTTMLGVEKYDLLRYFSAIVADEDTEKPKPAPDPILLCLKRLGKTPENAVMVGDTKHDIQSARAAGVPAVLVGWTLAVPKDEWYGPDKPDHIIEKPKDLLELIS